jgi:hypothetical protein
MTTPGNSYSSPVNLSLPATSEYNGPDESAALQFQYIFNSLATLAQTIGATPPAAMDIIESQVFS